MKLEGAKKGDYLTDRLTDEGVKVIEQAVADGKPLFLYQSYHSVHVPIQGKPELVTKIKEQQAQSGKTFNIQYAAMIQSLDAGVGRIMSTLERLDIADNTLVIFTSDNGGYAYSRGKKNNVTSCAPLRRGKGYNYEGGNRVACIATFPGKIPPDSTSITPLISTDFYPTILATIGLPLIPTACRWCRSVARAERSLRFAEPQVAFLALSAQQPAGRYSLWGDSHGELEADRVFR